VDKAGFRKRQIEGFHGFVHGDLMKPLTIMRGFMIAPTESSKGASQRIVFQERQRGQQVKEQIFNRVPNI